ncbi:MAPEG family protein [Ideonella alba]|uniref:MAPEG family protein n=1 Tax=Ideonella alba TaxID=2824118 RepID=UPI001FFD569C|nr:MAPEG family protein [Ideonella alba]
MSMTAVHLLAIAALLQYFVFSTIVGWARGKYGVAAPAVSGHPVFERHYRVQMNTLELLVMLLPALWLAGQFWSPTAAVVGGLVYLVGRGVYALSYVRNPASRTAGFALSIGPTLTLLIGAVVGMLRA